uniref:Uncharacterized protein n=1 Tax=Castor canadensis TaxID=51338 RepID=A0A8C0WRI2_CASCN
MTPGRLRWSTRSTEVPEVALAAEGQIYFDSGDYNMTKGKMKNKQLPIAAQDKTEVTGDHISIPQDLPQWKPFLIASKLTG